MKLVAEEGHWALHDNSMVFGNVVWLCESNDILIDDKHKEIPLEKPLEAYISV